MIKLTRFEEAKIIGLRGEQISKGAPSYIDTSLYPKSQKDALSIAQQELSQGKIPLVINRTFPNGNVVTIRVCNAIPASTRSCASEKLRKSCLKYKSKYSD